MKVLIWLILAIIWGSTWIFIKIGLADLPPITFASARFILALLLLYPAMKILKIPFPKGRDQWKVMATTGILQFSINYSSVFWSELYISSGLAAVLQATIPVFGLPLAWYFLPQEKMTPLKIIAVLLGVAGVSVIFFDQLAINDMMAFAGSAAIVIGAYAAAQSSVLVKARASGIHPVGILFAQMLCGLPPIVIYAFAAEGNPLNHNWSLRAVLCLLFLTLVGTIAAFWLYYWLLSKIESTRAMMISLVTPLLAVILGAVVLNEKLPPLTLAGGVLILASIAMIVFRKKDRADIPELEAAAEGTTGSTAS